jgi:hypothetical protein
MDTAGVERFARYAAPPNQRGYCGPEGFASARAVDDEQVTSLRRSAREFIGAYPYLELLAGAAGLNDPLVDSVVEAYWIGNPTLLRVRTGEFGRSLDDRFRSRAGSSWPRVELSVPEALCHHSFHVFVISPWVGLMRNGVVDEPLAIVDDCRVSWGRVVSISSPISVAVERTPLQWSNGQLVPGEPQIAEVRVDATVGMSVELNDAVAIHWGWVCDVLDPAQLAWLRWATHTQLSLAASIGRPC